MGIFVKEQPRTQLSYCISLDSEAVIQDLQQGRQKSAFSKRMRFSKPRNFLLGANCEVSFLERVLRVMQNVFLKGNLEIRFEQRDMRF